MDFHPVHLPLDRLKEIYSDELEKKSQLQITYDQLRKEAQDIAQQNEKDKKKLFSEQIEQFPAGVIKKLRDDIQNKIEIVVEELSLQNINSSVDYMKSLSINRAHKDKALTRIEEAVKQLQPEAIEKRHQAIQDIIANTDNVQATLRTELASVVASQQQNFAVFSEQMRKLNNTLSKLESSEQLVATKEREMRYFIESLVQQKLADKRWKIQKLRAECGKLVSAPQPIRLEPWLNDVAMMDCDKNKNQNEAEV